MAFIEPILEHIKLRLITNMPDKLNEIDSEKGDFVLDDIAGYYGGSERLFRDLVYTKFESTEQRKWVEEIDIIRHIGKVSSDLFPFIDMFFDSPGDDFTANSIITEHLVNIRIFAIDDNDENLAKRIYRYLRAITEIMKIDDDLGRQVDLIRFAGHEYGSNNEIYQGKYLNNGIAKFIISQEEVVQ